MFVSLFVIMCVYVYAYISFLIYIVVICVCIHILYIYIYMLYEWLEVQAQRVGPVHVDNSHAASQVFAALSSLDVLNDVLWVLQLPPPSILLPPEVPPQLSLLRAN